MKKVIFILIAAISFGLTGCITKRYAEYSGTLYYDEFDDFFITESNSVSFDYEPIGSVTAIAESGYLKRKYIRATANDALRVLYNEAEKNGANGIINLKITYNWEYDKYGNMISLSSIAVTGMAIRKY
jgi:uncharacterized protein YbjQ (UPF0145 family)